MFKLKILLVRFITIKQIAIIKLKRYLNKNIINNLNKLIGLTLIIL